MQNKLKPQKSHCKRKSSLILIFKNHELLFRHEQKCLKILVQLFCSNTSKNLAASMSTMMCIFARISDSF